MSEFVTIVVPTFREVINLPHLIPAISAALRKTPLDFEIIVVDDDSQDGSEDRVKELATEHPVRIIVRRHVRGLSSAVIEGFRQARGDFLVCMDADLSHPPGKIPALVEPLRDPRIDFVIASRYCAGGSTDAAWSAARHLNSWVSTKLARSLTSVTDPMSGFFALRRETFQNASSLSPVGYKIGLELLVKARCQNVREIPIHFADRKFGSSKLTLREQFNYLRHVKRLLDFKYGMASRLLQFGLVGTAGVAVDLVAFRILLHSLPVEAARAAAVVTAMTSNFWLNRRLTFSYSRASNWWHAYVRFVLSSGVGALVNWVVGVGLIAWSAWWRDHVTLAALAGILAGAAFNFVLCVKWAFAARRRRPESW